MIQTQPAGYAAPITTLVIVDDNDFDQRMYARIVSRSQLVEHLVQFTDPQEAARYLVDSATPMPDLVLLDINMPGMNGFEFLDEVTRRIGERMCPVVVMLTTSLDASDQDRAASYSVVRGFLNKPLTKELLKQLSDLVSGEAPLPKS